MGRNPRPFRFAVQSYRAESGAAWREIARRVEGMGYSTLHVTDHYLGPGPALDGTGHRAVTLAPIPLMAVAAEVTTTLNIGCRMFCVGYHEPYVLVKQVATLAELSGGRTEIGLGAGWLEAEYDAMGVPFPPAGERVTRLEETLQLLDQQLSGADLDVVGSQVRVHGFAPLPVPSPRPTVLVGGGSPRVLRIAGAMADVVSINFDNRSGVIGAASVASSGPDQTQRKLGWAREGAGERFGDVELETAAYFLAIQSPTGAALNETTEEQLTAQTGLGAADLRAFPHALVGSVAEICDQLEARREDYGFSYITVGDRGYEAFAPVVERLAGR